MYYIKEPVDNDVTMQTLSTASRNAWFYMDKEVAVQSSLRYLHGFIYESDIAEWAIENFSNKSGAFVDVGAHIGLYSCKLAPHFKEVFSFEPDPRIFCYLSANIALHQVEFNVNQYKLAVGNKNEITDYYVRSYHGGGNGINLTPNNDVQEIRKVKCITLDSFDPLQDTKISLIKIDTENGEKNVLLGAKSLLEKNNFPPILFESWIPERFTENNWGNQQRDELFTLIKDYGYEIFPLQTNREVFLAGSHPKWVK
jgi:FkbM family methyltransferase